MMQARKRRTKSKRTGTPRPPVPGKKKPPAPARKSTSSSRTKWLATWWGRLIAFVVGAGAVATAITAVANLWPKPDPVDRVVITSTTVTGPESLSGFVATATIGPQSGATAAPPTSGPVGPTSRADGLASPPGQGQQVARPEALPTTSGPAETTDASPTDTEVTDTSSDTSSATTETTGTTQTETTESGTSVTTTTGTTTSSTVPTSPPQPGRPPILAIPDSLRDRLYEEIRAEAALDAYALPTDVPSGPSPLPRAVHVIQLDAVNAQGEPVPPEVAAEELVARLQTVRSTPTPEGLDPLGVRATVNLEVEGLRGEPLLLYWRIVAAGDDVSVPAEWAQWIPAYELTPGTERDTASASVWVPLPEAPGPYRAELVVMHESESSPLTSHLTETFGE